MPDKDPSNMFALWASLPEPIRAAIMSMCIAVLRIIYDGREPKIVRRILEALLCGAITFGASSGLQAFGSAPGWGVFVGGAVGLLGADKVRELGRRYANKRAGE